MINAFDTAYSFLPLDLRTALDFQFAQKEKTASVTEIRLRCGAPLSLTLRGTKGEENRIIEPTSKVTEDMMRAILSKICRGSFHTYENEILRGWFSPIGSDGIRVGVAGDVLCEGGKVTVMREVRSLCLRLPQTCPKINKKAASLIEGAEIADHGSNGDFDEKKSLSSILFYAPPGVGKTTLLRDLIKSVCSGNQARRAAVIDASGELYTEGFSDCIADFFIGYPKEIGISLAVRAFSPEVLFCDELGSHEEAESLLRAQIGGVPIVATAHGRSLAELLCRPAFSALHKSRIFDRYIRLFRKGDTVSFYEERAGGDTC